jgi:hypothetical protein
MNFSDKFASRLILPLPALVAKWQTRTLEVRVEKSMGVRVSPSALSRVFGIHLSARLIDWFYQTDDSSNSATAVLPEDYTVPD